MPDGHKGEGKGGLRAEVPGGHEERGEGGLGVEAPGGRMGLGRRGHARSYIWQTNDGRPGDGLGFA